MQSKVIPDIKVQALQSSQSTRDTTNAFVIAVSVSGLRLQFCAAITCQEGDLVAGAGFFEHDE